MMLRTSARASRRAFQQKRRMAEVGAILAAAGGTGFLAPFAIGVGAGVGGYCLVRRWMQAPASIDEKVNWDAVRSDLEHTLLDETQVTGSWAPAVVRMVSNMAFTFDTASETGGCDGASIRHSPEKEALGNFGIDKVVERLESVYQKYKGTVSHADLYVLAACVGIKQMGGPDIAFRPGRTDADKSSNDFARRLPDPAGVVSKNPERTRHMTAAYMRKLFARLNVHDDMDIVALMGGGHTVGRMHSYISEYSGAHTENPHEFDNSYFKELLTRTWVQSEHDKLMGRPVQYHDDETGELTMMPVDMVLAQDMSFRRCCETLAQDDQEFRRRFASAFQRIVENGCEHKLSHATV
ncbi:MAG: hypothetical protein MHM6MM_002622 [Cercozoa sp. M6MM]